MAKEKKKSSFRVNLLELKDKQIPLEVKLLKWAISSGRYIIIFVEMIVIGAFVFRYKLDSDLTTIQEQIKEQVPYIESLKNSEVEIKRTQDQLANIRKFKSGAPDLSQVFAKIALLTPKNIRLTGINLDRTQNFPKTGLAITGQSPSTSELSFFISGLKKESSFTEISLTNISFEQQAILFTVSGTVISTK